MRSDDELKDWEIREEEPPERLKKKWEKEDLSGPRFLVCPACKKEVSSENLTCIFCGALLKPAAGKGIFSWIKIFFGGKP